MTPQRARAITCALTVAVIAAAGCSGSGRPPAGAGTLRVAVPGPLQLDPARADDPAGVFTGSLLYEPLVRVDPRTGVLGRGLAERWSANRHQTRFTFTLRTVTFHDGSPVTAQDVKATFERVAARVTGSPVAELLSSVQGYGDVHDTGSTTSLSGVRAARPRRVEIALTHPYADFPLLLAHPALGIVPRGQFPAATDPPGVVGSGAFKVVAKDTSSMTLDRVVAPGAVPSVARVKLVAVADADAAQAAVGRGDADVAVLGSDRGEPGRRGRVLDVGSLTVVSYAINLRSPKFSDPRFREAILRALNAERLARAGYRGAGEVATSFVPDTVPGSRSDVCPQVCQPNPGAASALIHEVFPVGGVPIVGLDFPETSTQRTLAEEAQVELGEAGIPVTLRPHPPDQYATFVLSGQAELFTLTAPGAALTQAAFLRPQFESGNPANVTGLSNPRVDEAIRAGDAERTPSRRQQRYATAQREVLEQFVLLPIAQLDERYLVGVRVRGLAVSPLGAVDTYRVRVYGSPGGRKKGGG